MSDIDQYTLADAQRYYDTHYSPQNATAIFVGDVKPAEVKELARRYFGRLKRLPGERPAVVTQEPEQGAERRTEAEADANDEVTITWHGPSAVHKDAAACDLLMSVFSGRSGRLYRPLVEDQKLALDTESYFWSLRYGGLLRVGASPREGIEPSAVEKAILGIVEDVRRNGISERELEKVRNQQVAELVRGLKTNNGIAQQLGYFETVGVYPDFFAYAKALEAATAADLKRCAELYLKPQGRNIVVIRRKEKK
jgi:predicted Zn-dependent peptidase